MGNTNEQNKNIEQKQAEVSLMRNVRGLLSAQIKIIAFKAEDILFLENIKNAVNNVINKDIQQKEMVKKSFEKRKQKETQEQNKKQKV